jgi:hypothetical protein
MAFDWPELASPVQPPTSSAMVAVNTNKNPPTKSFARALVSAATSKNTKPLPQPVIRGETLCIQISEETYARGVDVCKRNNIK